MGTKALWLLPMTLVPGLLCLDVVVGKLDVQVTTELSHRAWGPIAGPTSCGWATSAAVQVLSD